MRILTVLLACSLAACSTAPAPPEAVTTGRPLDTLPAAADLATVRSDLIATARERFGTAALNRALAAPTHLIVKRFAG
ncbi:MAG TPA: hypothetical protein VM308_09475, partial [Sphingomicrobium sp.]|nr:hypothetical protein [Sphingomicrobium sp.]